MDFGYFGLMGYRERGTPPRRVFEEHVEQVRQADATGLAIAWFAEHHFSNYCICPSPLIMAAHCAPVTEHIKLAPAVIVTPLYEPARVLAEIGMVDCLSGGRLVLGVGSGYQPYEFERFGVDITKARPMLEEFLDMLHAAFASETFSHDGEHYSMPSTHISARPVGGVPPIWVAGDNEFGHRLCARRGYTPMITGRWCGAEYLREMRARIDRAFELEGHAPGSAPVGIQRFMCVTSSRAETLEYVDNARHQMRLASALRRRAEVMDGAMMNEIPMVDEVSIERMADNLLVGDCETNRRTVVRRDPRRAALAHDVPLPGRRLVAPPGARDDGEARHRHPADGGEGDRTAVVHRRAASGSHERGRGLSPAIRPGTKASPAGPFHPVRRRGACRCSPLSRRERGRG